jgi:hypothetical protein
MLEHRFAVHAAHGARSERQGIRGGDEIDAAFADDVEIGEAGMDAARSAADRQQQTASLDQPLECRVCRVRAQVVNK